jgi:hypothetical protein
MKRVPQSDPDSLEHVAGKVEVLHDHFKDSKGKMIGVAGPNPFGDIRHPDNRPGEHPSEAAVNALGSFKDRMHSQFDAAAELMKSTGGTLRDAARIQRETEAAAKDSVTMKDDSLQA